MKNSIELQLKESLQQAYNNSDSFLRDIIFPVFGEENYESAGNLNVLRKRPDLQSKADASGIMEIHQVGGLYVEGSQLDIFDVTLDYKKQLRSNRVEIQQIIRSILGTHSGAFIIFHYESGARWEWRFTFCHKGASQIDSSDAKRYTFLLGPGQSCRTAAENFMKIHEKIEREGAFEMDDIIKAFDVEALSKEFFNKYKEHYEKFCQFIYDHKQEPEWFGHEFAEWEDKTIRDYVKKLLGRIVFLHFLQKKGWMGVPADKEWGNGDVQFMKRLFDNASEEQKSNYLDEVLEPLFHYALNSDRKDNDNLFNTGVEGFQNVKIPYLNGGLFERDVLDEPDSVFPALYFRDLLEFLYEYNFTIDENDPSDAEVGIDPEMLGMIFENLLEDNKDKGAFYTPKEIVQYMCRESLIAYLQTGVEDEATKQSFRDFVTEHEVCLLKPADVFKVDKKLREVKICDPAIGSGAFPMGLLKELFACRMAIEGEEEGQTAAEIKKDIIQNSIYGVDIEKGAVDIARLRFWLSLILDEDTPNALPNMDFKIMQGNSLLEQYKGLDLSKITEGKKIVQQLVKIKGKKYDMSSQIEIVYEGKDAVGNIQKYLSDYYTITDHNEKEKCRKCINDSIHDFIRVSLEGNDAKVLDELEKLPLENNKFFLWHTWFSDVFEKGGFDIVIANPPYLKERDNKKTFAPLLESKWGKDYHTGKMDYWFYFMHKSIELSSDDPVICFITSRYWVNSSGAKKVIKHIGKELSIRQIIDIGDLKLFSNVVGHHMIALYGSRKKLLPCHYRRIEEDVKNIIYGNYAGERLINQENLIINDEIVLEERDVVRCNTKLSDFCIVSQGVVEASDKISAKMYKRIPLPEHKVGEGIFVLSSSELESLHLNEVERQYIKPYIGDGCISRYCIRYNESRNLIYADEKCRSLIKNSEDFVNLRMHLDRFKEYITSCWKPYGIHRARKVEYFTSSKIISPSMFAHPSFAYDDKGLFVGMSYNVILPNEGTNLLYILGLLNSSFADKWFYDNAKHRGVGVDVGVEKLRDFPIPNVDKSLQEEIAEKVQCIINKKANELNANVDDLEDELDHLVYNVYEGS